MTAKEALLKEIETAPEPLLREVLAFLRLLEARDVPPGLQTAIASEPLLAREWSKPEEDAAWKDL
jgi:hypothetical protein